jgi:anti-sigma-K factor RskA
VNVKEYISSGIIESYVMGLLSESEQQEFESVCAQYPEVAQATESFEISLEDTLLSDAIAPPAHIKGKIEGVLFNGQTQSQIPQTVIYEEETPVRSMAMWKWLAAASFILLAGTLFWAVTTNNKYQNLQKANKDLEQELNNSTAQLNELKEDAATLQKQGMKMASMQGTQKAPGAFANVYWDSTTKDVYLLINNMPQPVSEHQYQLWALINGKPVDLGVVEYSLWQKNLLVRMKNVQKAEAFAITLEPKGGSENPTMDEMYVMGKL